MLAWSPDGASIAFEAGGATGNDLLVYSTTSDRASRVVSWTTPQRYFRDHPDLRWSLDGNSVIYSEGGSYYRVVSTGGTPELLIAPPTGAGFAQLSPDQSKISYIMDGDIWMQSIHGGEPMRLTRDEKFLEDKVDYFTRLLQWPQWSPDSSTIAFTSTLTEVRVVSLKGETVVSVSSEAGMTFPQIDWSPDSRHLTVSWLSLAYTRKQLVVCDVVTGKTHKVWEETDDKWVSEHYFRDYRVAWSTDGGRFAFISGKSGWKHAYIVDVDDGMVRELTEGPCDVDRCVWSPDDRYLLVVSNEGNLQQWLPWMIPVEGGSPRPLVNRTGVSSLPQFSPDGRRLAFVFSDTDNPSGLFITTTKDGGQPTLCYRSLPEELREQGIGHIEAVSFPSADGTRVPATLYTPPGFDSDKHYPALVIMYGHWLQLASLGWGGVGSAPLVAYLVHQGYVVLKVDPRGSEGYGDAYAKSYFHEAAGRQVEDMVAAAEYLKSSGFVSPNGVAIYSRSYGGYLAVETVLRAPQAYAACVADAGVYDLPKYWDPNSAYTRIRFGSPDQEHYPLVEKSPVRLAGNLQAALYLFHGTGDFNVPISQTEAMVKALMEAHKEFEYMAYPGEPHDWESPFVIRDHVLRVERYLDEHLRHP